MNTTERNIVTHGGRELPSEDEVFKALAHGILFFLTTIPDRGIGGAGATTFARNLLIALGLSKNLLIHAGGVTRQLAREYFMKNDHTRLQGITGELPDKLVTEYLRTRVDGDADLAIDRATTQQLMDQVRRNLRTFGVADSKLAPFIADENLSVEQGKKVPFAVFYVGVGTRDDVAIERRHRDEIKKIKESGGKTLPSLMDVEASRIGRRKEDEKRYQSIYGKKRIPAYTKKAVEERVHFKIDSTEAASHEQVIAFLTQLISDYPILAHVINLHFAQSRLDKEEKQERAKKNGSPYGHEGPKQKKAQHRKKGSKARLQPCT